MGMYADWINDMAPVSLPAISSIQRVVANRFDTPLEELIGEDRYRPLVLRRHLAIYLCAKVIGKRYSDVGRAFNRDRATISHSVDRIAKIIKIDPEFAEIVEDLIKEISLQPTPTI